MYHLTGTLHASARHSTLKPSTRQTYVSVSRRKLSISAKGFSGFGKSPKEEQPAWVLDKTLCPCGTGARYADCCQRYHDNRAAKAPSADSVLRARFSAYVKKEREYIIRTTTPDNAAAKGSVADDPRPGQDKIVCTFDEDIKVTMRVVDFRDLKILAVEPGPGPNQNIVSCTYRIKNKRDASGTKLKNPQWETVKERALFQYDDDSGWMYVGSQSPS